MIKLGELLEDERGAVEEAEDLYQRATTLEPRNSEALFSHGSFLLFVRLSSRALLVAITFQVWDSLSSSLFLAGSWRPSLSRTLP